MNILQDISYMSNKLPHLMLTLISDLFNPLYRSNTSLVAKLRRNNTEINIVIGIIVQERNGYVIE